METIQDTPITEANAERRLLWHRPAVQRLDVSVTTQDFAKDGSGEDLGVYAFPTDLLQ